MLMKVSRMHHSNVCQKVHYLNGQEVVLYETVEKGKDESTFE